MSSPASASNSELCSKHMRLWIQSKTPENLEHFGIYAATFLADDQGRHWFSGQNKALGSASLMIFAFAENAVAKSLIAKLFDHLFSCQECVVEYEECVRDLSGMATASSLTDTQVHEFQRLLFQLTQEQWDAHAQKLLDPPPETERAFHDLSTCFLAQVYSFSMSLCPNFVKFEPFIPRFIRSLAASGFKWAPGYFTCMVLWPDSEISSQVKQILETDSPYDPKPLDKALFSHLMNSYKHKYPPASQKTTKEWNMLWKTTSIFFSHLSLSPTTRDMAMAGVETMRQCRQLDLGSTAAAVEFANKGADIRLCTRQFCRSKLGSERGEKNQLISKMLRAINKHAPNVFEFVQDLVENSQGLNSIKVGAIALSSLESFSEEATIKLLQVNPEPVIVAMGYIPSDVQEKLANAISKIIFQQNIIAIAATISSGLTSEMDISTYANKEVIFKVTRQMVFSNFFLHIKLDDSAPVPASGIDTRAKEIITRFSNCSSETLTPMGKIPGFLSALWLFGACTDTETSILATKTLSLINSSQLELTMTIQEMINAISSIMAKKAYGLCLNPFINVVEKCINLAATSNSPVSAISFWDHCWDFIIFLWNVDQLRATGFTNTIIKDCLRASTACANTLILVLPQFEAHWESTAVAEQRVQKLVSALSAGAQLLCLQRSSGVLANVFSIFKNGLEVVRKYKLGLQPETHKALSGITTSEKAHQLSTDETQIIANLIGVKPAMTSPLLALPLPEPPRPTESIARTLESTLPKRDLKSFFQTVPRQQAISSVQKQLPPAPPPKPKDGSKLAMIREELEAKRQRASDGAITKVPPKNLVIHPARPSGFNAKEKPTSSTVSKPTPAASSSKPNLNAELESSDSDDNSDEDSQGLIPLGRGKNGARSLDKLGSLTSKKSLRPPQADERAQEAARMKARMLVSASGLHKSILLWDYYSKGQYPPELQGHNIKVPDKFESVDQYVKVMRPLLLMEVWQQILQQRDALKESRNMIFSLTVGTRTVVDDFVEMNFSMQYDVFQAMNVSDGDLILLMLTNPEYADSRREPGKVRPHCFAKMKDKTSTVHYSNNIIDFTVRTHKADAFLKHLTTSRPVAGLKVISLITAEREYRALRGFEHCELRKEIMNAEPSTPVPPNPTYIKQLTDNMGLNGSQAMAAWQSLSSEGFNLIQGPPGTGKTKTILSIIGAFFSNPSNKRILVCAPSNAAVDELLTRMKAGTMNLQGKMMNLKAVRLGRPDSVSPSVVDLCLDRQIESAVTKKANIADHSIRDGLNELVAKRDELFSEYEAATDLSPEQHMSITKELEEMRRQISEKKKLLAVQREQLDIARRTKEAEYKRVQNEILSNAQVVCCTLSGSASSILSSLELPFKTVIIDEAAQSIELSALIPFRYGCTKCIMVGDPHQLPPTVMNKAAAALDYEQSLFTRIFKQHQNKVSMLNEQFRMHPDIAVFPSKQFYKGLLHTGPGMLEKTTRTWHQSSMFSPYYFYSVLGSSQKFSGGRSLQNPQEAEAALGLVQTLFDKFPQVDFADKIGIVTPYKQQMVYIRDLFRRKLGNSVSDSVTFSTIDAFQGQEKDIIIFSTVRASSDRASAIGFVGDIRRMNVAITRARASLWVIGAANTLSANSEWRRLINDARERKMYCEARSDEFRPGLESIQKRFAEEERQYHDDYLDDRSDQENQRNHPQNSRMRPRKKKKHGRREDKRSRQHGRDTIPYNSDDMNRHGSTRSADDNQYSRDNRGHRPPYRSNHRMNEISGATAKRPHPDTESTPGFQTPQPSIESRVKSSSERADQISRSPPKPTGTSSYTSHAKSGLFNVKKPRQP